MNLVLYSILKLKPRLETETLTEQHGLHWVSGIYNSKTKFKSCMSKYLTTLLLTKIHIQLMAKQKYKGIDTATILTTEINLLNIRKQK